MAVCKAKAKSGTRAISNRGEIAGFFLDSAGLAHGLLLKNRTFTTFDFPGAAQTAPLGIDSKGGIVGGWFESSGIFHGFAATGRAAKDPS
jgi:hypothetical protein